MSQNIDGVPVGTKIIAIRRARAHEWILKGESGVLVLVQIGAVVAQIMENVYPIIEPDNVYGAINLAAVPISDGYERVAHISKPEIWFTDPHHADAGEYFLTTGGTACSCNSAFLGYDGDRRRIILRKIAPPVKRVLVCEWEIGDPTDSTLGNVSTKAAERVASAARGIGNTFGDISFPTPPRAWIRDGLSPVVHELLAEFGNFCCQHSDLSFWQALAAWSGKRIMATASADEAHPPAMVQDTFHWKGRNG